MKIEDAAPTEYHSSRDEAVLEAESMAKDNAPSKAIIYDAHQEVEEQRQF
ncbi:DUF2188 domain-containing protein [Terribacillus aidingensis]|nr:DUF2188 domain-containing protein [Terribacillus aidingensis]